ncbi:uncharacterized protein LOC129942619 [Eupeodes corollae]|uniref:uncharacterized protein LOC129942619 n=1 Tax=Eupeodes corollae TaxID=290404 RepID=UPI00248FE283|nr:uncharacterized protein LOC129942619 [Eupeodes corollae]
MELSSDNIEELATVLNSDASHQEDVFRSKTGLLTLDVDRVISEAQDSLLNSSLEAISSCDVPCSFNDILDDICKMNNSIEMQQAAVNTVATPHHQLPLETTAYYHMPDLEMQSEDYASECNLSNQTDFLQPLGQWSEYLPLPPSSLSTIQDIPQLAPIPTTIPSPPPVPVEAPQTISFSSDIPMGSVHPNAEEKTAIVGPSVQFLNDYPMPLGLTTQQNEMPNSNLHFTQVPECNINFMMIPESSMAMPMGAPHKRIVQQSPPFFDWARVVPRRTFIQPSEIVVLRPLRTRKVMSSRPSFDLASYFDTSSISIPMIRERPRCRTYRRKQKLYTIPGADNLVFEVHLRPPEHEEIGDSNNNNEDGKEQLYAETEIPELDKIFKRKRRTLNTRRVPATQESIKVALEVVGPQPEFQPIEVASKKIEKMSPSPSRELESPSDVDSDDAPLTIVKSMKCSNCQKLFKTYRSLAIHSKRCTNVATTPANAKESSPELLRLPRTTSCRVSVQRRSSKENIECKYQDGGEKGGGEDKVATRPLTRSQTRNALKRKATSEDDGGGPQKQAK